MFRWLTLRKDAKKRTVNPAAIAEIAEELLAIRLALSASDLNKSFSIIMTNKVARGYVFGFIDSIFQRYEVTNPENVIVSVDLLRGAYEKVFRESSGRALLDMSLHVQADPDYHRGRMVGGNEVVEF